MSDLFFGGRVPRGKATLVGKHVRDLREMGATDAEVRTRHRRAVEAWGSSRVTINSLLTNWGTFAVEPTVPMTDRERRDAAGNLEFMGMLEETLGDRAGNRLPGGGGS